MKLIVYPEKECHILLIYKYVWSTLIGYISHPKPYAQLNVKTEGRNPYEWSGGRIRPGKRNERFIDVANYWLENLLFFSSARTLYWRK
jgi:hypothetical protein